MITSLIYSLVKLLLGILAVVFGLLFALVLLGVSLPTGLYHQLGRLCLFVNDRIKRGKKVTDIG